MTKTEKLFDEVIKTIHARGESYGHPYYNHKRIGRTVECLYWLSITTKSSGDVYGVGQDQPIS